VRAPRAHVRLGSAVAAMMLLAASCTDDDPRVLRPRPRDREPTTTSRPADTTLDDTTLDDTTLDDTTLEWRECDSGECADLTVPLDYEDPAGTTIEVALIRLPAREPDRRVGSLLVNPGGPGASGVDFVRNSAFAFPDELRDRFDLVGFDPRGTGETVPVSCVESLDDVLALDYSPDSPGERVALEAGVRELTDACAAGNADVLPHISSQDTVRDMDRIRQAVGDAKLTYVGFSYGTYLGALYANFFPDKVRALVLDGAVDPELSSVETNLQQAAGFERSLSAFLDRCSEDEDCAFHNGGEPHRAFDELVVAVDGNPLPAADGRRLGPNELDLGVAQALYAGELGWGELADALGAAADGDGTELLALSDQYTRRRDDGTYGGLLESFWAIGCIDGPSIGPPGDFPALEEEFQQAAPRFGVTFLYSGLVCSYWPVEPAPDPGPLTAPGADPILVVGTTGDPATPLQWAESLAGALDSGVLVAAEGEQHTSVFFAGNSCVDRIALRYLIALEVPDDGTRCE
jgi:pimeloyl-ACP methyl ester carboxylesterase